MNRNKKAALGDLDPKLLRELAANGDLTISKSGGKYRLHWKNLAKKRDFGLSSDDISEFVKDIVELDKLAKKRYRTSKDGVRHPELPISHEFNRETKLFQVRVDPELAAAFDDFCKAAGMPKRDAAEEMLRKFLSDQGANGDVEPE